MGDVFNINLPANADRKETDPVFFHLCLSRAWATDRLYFPQTSPWSWNTANLARAW